jgi:hypothetical protein
MLKNILLSGLFLLSACVHKPLPSMVEKTVVIDPPVVVIPEKYVTWHIPGSHVGLEASAKNKMVILFFYDNSDASLLMKKKVFTNICVINQIESNYILVGVNIDNYPIAAEALKNKKLEVPVMMFAFPDSTLLPFAGSSNISPRAYCSLLEKLNKDFHDEINKK